MLFVYVWKPVFFFLSFLSLVPVWFFIMVLIRANLFHNLSYSVSCALHLFLVLIYLFLILGYNLGFCTLTLTQNHFTEETETQIFFL